MKRCWGNHPFRAKELPSHFFFPIFKAGHYPFVGFHFVLCQLLTSALAVDSPTAIALGSSAKGFGAELLSDSLEFSGADPSCSAKSFRGRFHQGFSKVPPRFFKFPDLGRSVFGVPKGSVEGSPIASFFPCPLVPQFNSFLLFLPNSVSFGVCSHSTGKGLGARLSSGVVAANVSPSLLRPGESWTNIDNPYSPPVRRFYHPSCRCCSVILWV